MGRMKIRVRFTTIDECTKVEFLEFDEEELPAVLKTYSEARTLQGNMVQAPRVYELVSQGAKVSGKGVGQVIAEYREVV